MSSPLGDKLGYKKIRWFDLGEYWLTYEAGGVELSNVQRRN